MFTDLREYLTVLEKEKELVHIRCAVEPKLEVAEIHRRVIGQGGPALLFDRPEGSTYRLVTNLFGTARRTELAFGSKPERTVERLAQILDEPAPLNARTLWSYRNELFGLSRLGLKRRTRGAVAQSRFSPPQLERLPCLTTWPDDGGPFFTLPLVHTAHPITNVPNLGMYRMHRYDSTTTGMHFQIGKGGGFHLSEARRLGRSLPVNVYLGGPPALILAAITPLPENVPELLFASFVMGKKLELLSHPDAVLPLVANAEFALIGEVDGSEFHPEGPFGDHYGYYSLRHDYPVFRCKSLLARRDAIFPATVVGKPRQEDFYIGEYLQKLLKPLIRKVMPSVRDVWSYGETGFHSLAAAVVHERYKREALMSALRILGEGQLSLTKFLLVLDRPCELTDFRFVLRYVLERIDPHTDVYILGNTSMDTLDYAGPRVNEGSKGILLGIGEQIRDLPSEISPLSEVHIENCEIFCAGCLVVSGKPYAEDVGFPQRLSQEARLADWPLIIVADDAEDVCSSTEKFLWSVFTRFEPARDLYSRSSSVRHNQVTHELPLVIDARMKPWYPPTVECDSDTKHLVDRRWKDYFGGVGTGE